MYDEAVTAFLIHGILDPSSRAMKHAWILTGDGRIYDPVNGAIYTPSISTLNMSPLNTTAAGRWRIGNIQCGTLRTKLVREIAIARRECGPGRLLSREITGARAEK
jgi:hypothetical protein